MSYQDTRLWKSAFNSKKRGSGSKPQKRLENQYLLMREHVGQLISHIPADCRDLTVHDITHLDALWESAEVVCGDDWCLNPAETFVFGAAALVHDAGLTTLAYKGGVTELKETDLWADLEAAYKKSEKYEGGDKVNEDAEALILFEVLRTLHAKQASLICTRTYGDPAQYLIEDSELREAFGESIGRIASSHHWDAGKITSELSQEFGGSPSLPLEWTINECKIACLLRCADAAQVDRTRAPSLLYASLAPSGNSGLHWKAQNKLNRPHLKADAIYFASSSAYLIADADSWWLAYDLASTLEKELRASNAILTEIGEKTFSAQRVAGAENPETFARYVKPSGWRPVDASVRVTDPLRLAQNLGGRNLYGASVIVPFREVIQNAADAIRARRALEGRGQDFGQITITIEPHPSQENMCLVHVDDNGIGMSERVLSTSLIDFGKSFWNSSLLRNEFPGLNASKFKSIGTFGIGFFSIFEVSPKVTVTSKKYTEAVTDARSICFNESISRPLVRSAEKNELPLDVSTRITFILNNEYIKKIEEDNIEHMNRIEYLEYYKKNKSSYGLKRNITETLKQLVSFLDIKVYFKDKRNDESFIHLPNIYEISPKEFINSLGLDEDDKKTKFFSVEEKLKSITDNNGDSYGRASLDIDAILKYNNARLSYNGTNERREFVSVGGVVSSSLEDRLSLIPGYKIPYFGVIEGKVERASRDFNSLNVPLDAIEKWLSEQINSIDRSVLRTSELMSLSVFSLNATGKSYDLPFAFHKGKVKTLDEIKQLVENVSRFIVPAYILYNKRIKILNYSALSPDFFDVPLFDEVIVFATGSSEEFEKENLSKIIKSGKTKLNREDLFSRWENGKLFIRQLENIWGGNATLFLERSKIFDTNIASLCDEDWVVSINRSE